MFFFPLFLLHQTLEVKVEVRRDETKKVVRKDDGPAEEAQQ